MFSIVTWALDHIFKRAVVVRVRVHLAGLLLPNDEESPHEQLEAALFGGGRRRRPRPAWFINVLNVSPDRTVVVTHVWLETDPPVQVMTKPLPHKLPPDEVWETWIEVDQLPSGVGDVSQLARVRLATGKTIKSEPRTDVPPMGYVPG